MVGTGPPEIRAQAKEERTPPAPTFSFDFPMHAATITGTCREQRLLEAASTYSHSNSHQRLGALTVKESPFVSSLLATLIDIDKLLMLPCNRQMMESTRLLECLRNLRVSRKQSNVGVLRSPYESPRTRSDFGSALTHGAWSRNRRPVFSGRGQLRWEKRVRGRDSTLT